MAKKKATKKTTAKKSRKKASKKKKTNIVVLGDSIGGIIETSIDDDFDGSSLASTRMMMEKMMRQITRKIQFLNLSPEDMQNVDLTSLLNSTSTSSVDSPEEEAQELLYTAFETHDPKKRAAIARKVLKLDPNNVDALLILAELPSQRVFDRISGYRAAVKAGEQSLGKEFFEENEGCFWGIHETRPYMRAMERLAANLHFVANDQEHGEEVFLKCLHEAKEIYQKMLRLNPGDNQGVRYSLLYLLLELDEDDEAEKLYKTYKDDYSAWWLYGRALLDYRKQGDTAKSRKSLAKAVEYNKHFPLYLLKRKAFPAKPPAHYGIGDANEAAFYMDSSITVWANTPGAIDWVRQCIDKQ